MTKNIQVQGLVIGKTNKRKGYWQFKYHNKA